MQADYKRKHMYINSELLKEIKIDYIKKDKHLNKSKLARKVWEFYLEKDFELKGYKNIIGEDITTTEMKTSKIAPIMEEELINKIDNKLAHLEKEYNQAGIYDKQFYSLSYVTMELLKRVYLEREFEDFEGVE